MIEIRTIDERNKADINIPNEPFLMSGKFVPSYDGREWSYKLLRFAPENITEACFPDENYDYNSMSDCVFLGAYDGDECVGLAILRQGFFKYMYLYDLKVNGSYRGQGIGKLLIRKAKETAVKNGYRGVYTQAQDDNMGACLFYLNSGFYIGGLDTNVYRHTGQEGKADVIFYCEADF